MPICFFAGALYGWSALIAPLQSIFGISTADAGLAFSLAIVSFTVAVIVVPLLSNSAASPRMLAGLSLVGALFVFMAMRAPTYQMFLLWFSGGFGATSGAIYIVALAIAAKSCAPNVATPVMVASFGVGGAVFGPLWRILGNAGWGLDSLSFLAAGLLASSIVAWIFGAASAPSERALSSAPKTSLASTNAKRLALIWLTFAFGSFTGLMVLGMAAKMMSETGLSLSIASAALAGIAVCNTAGRLSAAVFSRKGGVGACLAISFGLTVLGLVALFFSFSWAEALAIGLMLLAAGYGLTASSIPMITQIAFDPAEFQRRFSLIFTAWGVAGFCAPWSDGLLFDLTGNFNLALLTAAGSCLGFGVSAFVLIRSLKERP